MIPYKVNDVIKGRVTGIEDYGFFVSFEDSITGLVHISEISNGYVKNVADYVDMGEEIFVQVIDINERNKKLKLSIKNIDYRITHKKKSGILETKSGFSHLENSLHDWIVTKEEELAKK